jgi:hypothetical protein
VEVGNHVGDGYGVAGSLGDAEADAPHDAAPISLDHFNDR